tara:strand:- start:330 stop:467 length:138 start_codon:yes stop_codon:yes gene_type:complete
LHLLPSLIHLLETYLRSHLAEALAAQAQAMTADEAALASAPTASN